MYVTLKDVIRYVYEILVKLAWKEDVMENPRRRWQDNTGMDLKKAWSTQNFSISEERPVAGCISNSKPHSNSKRCEEFLDKFGVPKCIKTGIPTHTERHEIFGPKRSTMHMRKKKLAFYITL